MLLLGHAHSMTTASDPFLPPLSDLVNSAQRALLYECIPPLPDAAGRICVVCDTVADQPSSIDLGDLDLAPGAAVSPETGRRYRQLQLLGVGLLASPQTWLQHLSELPESRNYPADGVGSVYVVAWESAGMTGTPVPAAQTVVNASLAVLESHPLSLGGGVACSEAGYEWVTGESVFGHEDSDATSWPDSLDGAGQISQCGGDMLRGGDMLQASDSWVTSDQDDAGLPGSRGTGPAKDLDAEHQVCDPVIAQLSPQHWWVAAQRAATSRDAWVMEGWCSWKQFLGVAEISADENPSGVLFTSWTHTGQLGEGPVQSAQSLALMVAALDDPALRDAVLLAGALHPVQEHTDLLDHLVGSGDAGELANLLTSIFRGTQPPAWQHLSTAQGRVAGLCRSAPARYRARCLAMIAWWAWFAGDVGRAHQLAARASLDDDSVRLARLVTQACEFEVWPGWRRNQSRAS